ncbi:ribonuclease HI family protein [bacterium]|nr:ribonuclease HI family protein [bacterium]
MKKLIAYIDGASKGNPGKASLGFLIQDNTGKVLKESGASIGNATCNIAEYMALIAALIDCLEFECTELEIRSDSQLLIKQMQGSYKVKDEWLKKMNLIAERLVKRYKKVDFIHIPREENKQADKLANSHIETSLL